MEITLGDVLGYIIAFIFGLTGGVTGHSLYIKNKVKKQVKNGDLIDGSRVISQTGNTVTNGDITGGDKYIR